MDVALRVALDKYRVAAVQMPDSLRLRNNISFSIFRKQVAELGGRRGDG